jgi:hypothetical protein
MCSVNPNKIYSSPQAEMAVVRHCACAWCCMRAGMPECLYKVGAWQRRGHETSSLSLDNATAQQIATLPSSALPLHGWLTVWLVGQGPGLFRPGGWAEPSAQATGWGVRGARAFASMNCRASSTCSSSAGAPGQVGRPSARGQGGILGSGTRFFGWVAHCYSC